jgi:hypothetical protein
VKSKHQDHSELLCSWGFKHSDLEMLSKVDSENDMLEMLIGNYQEFSFSVVMEIKIVWKRLLSELQ